MLTDLLIYGNPLDMRTGWIKFSKNPVISGSNTLLPLNPDNITDQTILLPDPGGVPQDQSIIRGKGRWEGKWLLLFNHTPDMWPNDYYWSMVSADSLAPLKRGINPFSIESDVFPLYGPIDNQAPNDWIEIGGTFYAPDETYDGDSHMWISPDLIQWTDLGKIQGINGSDPGILYDGAAFYLFNESDQVINYNRLSADLVHVTEGDQILDVGGHTGDADVSFFNNQWHMFFDDGPHLHYEIGYASAAPEDFPYGWQMVHRIYGPHNPEQGQIWDDDTPAGNAFGTGDADIALEGTTLYLFTERPVGAAFRELTEVLDGEDQEIRILVEVDTTGDGLPDESTGWQTLRPGTTVRAWERPLTGRRFRIRFELETSRPAESPVIRRFRLSGQAVSPSRLSLSADPKVFGSKHLYFNKIVI
jgi:hypothetical protein